jgi:hypothetical protein
VHLTINLAGASAEQKAPFQGEAFTQTIAAIRNAMGDTSATVEVHGATPYVSYIDVVQNIADLERGIADAKRTKLPTENNVPCHH